MKTGTISWKYERSCLARGLKLIAGVDEAGRGPLAGPVVAAAVILPLDEALPDDCFGLNDSKKLSERRREELYVTIHEKAIAVGVGMRSPEEIDSLNILRATMQAMADAVTEASISAPPEFLLVDGNYFRSSLRLPYQTIVHGDGLAPSIAAASIVAKVTRDRIMRELHGEFPEYNFAANKGYGTLEHREAIDRYGYCPVHRRSFKIKPPQQKLFTA